MIYEGKMAKILLSGLDKSESQIFDNKIECEWLSTQQAARYLSISENALRIMVHREQIGAFKIGRRLRFKFSDCQKLFSKKEF